MRTLMMILVALVLVACSACDDSGSEPTKPERFTVTWTANSYHLVIRFDEIDGMGGLVDEKTVNAQATHAATHHLVEYFAVDDWCIDNQWFKSPKFPGVIIEGKLYGATVTGANLNDKGFGVLPQNMSGDFVTDIDPEFPPVMSPEYFASYPIAGTVTSRSVREIHYRTECMADDPRTPETGDVVLLVTWDGVDHWFPRP